MPQLLVVTKENSGDNLNAVVTATGNDTAVIQFLVAAGAVASLLLWWKRSGKKEGILMVLALFLCMSGNGTRSGVDFHAVALWNLALTIILLLGMEENMCGQKWRGQKTAFLLACIGCYLVRPYAAMAADHAVYRQGAVGDVDEQIVAMTEPGEEM